MLLKTLLYRNCSATQCYEAVCINKSSLKKLDALADRKDSTVEGTLNGTFKIVLDNIDLRITTRDMTCDRQNKDIHWVNHNAVKNRVTPGNNKRVQLDLSLLDYCQLLPSAADHEKLRKDFTHLVSRVLVEHLPCMQFLQTVCLQHIPHQYSNEMAQKSEKVFFKRHYSSISDADKGSLFADRNLINRRNVTSDVHSNWANCKAFALLEIKARIIAAAMVILGMENINEQPKHLPVSFDMRNGTDQQKKKYLNNISGKIVDQFVLDEHSLNDFVNNVLSEQEQEDIVNNQNLTVDGRFPCRSQGCDKSFKYDGKRRRDHELTHDPPPVIPEKPVISPDYPKEVNSTSDADDVFNYNCSVLNQGLLFMDFLDATSEGDGERSIRCWKFFLLHFKEEKSTTKYSLEALYLLFQVYSLLPPDEAHSLVWNRTSTTKVAQGKMLL
ncbi:hypothetical protein OS493_008262 [Desmophyllum pertusum]|uniref:DUF6589 domain-containing protein n=1 Tax=Desmophyllum pertusum TaxID=174260 RepID=A0A9X0DCH7_9CNID|nr:hypothetical protein OS493_008262 [Desmophyllum pertusum]